MRPPGVLKAKGSNPDIGSEFFLSIVDFDKEDSIYLFPLIHPKKGKKDNLCISFKPVKVRRL